MSEERINRIEKLLEEIREAVSGPANGSRIGLVARVEALETQRQRESVMQKLTPAGIATVIVGFFEAVKYFFNK